MELWPDNKKIIIFDDDEDILSICTYILEDQGWEVTSFSDCNDIVERVNSIRPFVIFMDNWIPDEGGIAATQKIRSSSGHLRCTGHLLFCEQRYQFTGRAGWCGSLFS
jgi:DNA-binding NtrC family response regulator